MVSVGFLSFLIMGIVVLAGLRLVNEKLNTASIRLGDSTASFTENLAEEMVKKRMSLLTQEKAERFSQDMNTTVDDVKYLSSMATRILKNPHNYSHHPLPDPLKDVIESGKAYSHFSRNMRQKYGSDAFLSEQRQLSSLSDLLELEMEYYSGVFIGSERGFLIAADTTKDGSPKQFTKKFLDNYDPREMGWYKLGKENRKPAFTDVYIDSNGMRCVTCVMPFFDGSGQVAGVVGIDFNAEESFRVTGIQQEDSENSQESGSFILDSSNGNILFSSRKEGDLAISHNLSDLRNHGETSLALAAVDMAAGNRGVRLVLVDGTMVYLAYAPIEFANWSLGILTGQTEVLYPSLSAKNSIDSQMEDFQTDLHFLFSSMAKWYLVFFALMLAGLFFASTFISRKLVKPILTLVGGVRQIAQGNLDTKIAMNRTDELGYLAECIDDMTVDLKKHIERLSKFTAEKERIDTELSIGASIQKGMLPRLDKKFSDNGRFEMFAAMDTAKEVGGDFYDFYMLDDHRLVITIADVSGKGVPAALFMVISKTILKNFVLSAGKETDFSNVIEQANRQICENNEEMLFVTVFFGVLDIRTGVFSYINCGHNPPLIRHSAEGHFQYICPKKKNLVMGAVDEAVFSGETLRLDPGDILFLYTDGVTEAMDGEGRLYSEERLKETLDSITEPESVSVKEILSFVRQDINVHVGDTQQSDDITMLGLRFLGTQGRS